MKSAKNTQRIQNYFKRVKQDYLNVKFVKKWSALFMVLGILSISFMYGWYFDNSKPHAGRGWADQNLYTEVARTFASGELPKPGQLHFPVGYSLLGAPGALILSADPFVFLSYLLLMASAIFCYLAVKYLFGRNWAVIFCLLLFAWDGVARSMHFSSDLFTVPWNNQILFFAFSFFFWLLTTKTKNKPSPVILTASALVAGVSFATREESILFVIPLLAGYLLITKSDWKQWAIAFLIMFSCFIPQIIVKTAVLDSITKSGHDAGYSQTAGKYFRPEKLYRNTLEVIIDSKHFAEPQATRKALLQEIPWLWISPIGVGIILFGKRYSTGLKFYVVVSIALALFYLSGSNMSAQKLQFHCLRYISPSFIVLNLGVLIVARELFNRAKMYPNTKKQ